MQKYTLIDRNFILITKLKISKIAATFFYLFYLYSNYLIKYN